VVPVTTHGEQALAMCVDKRPDLKLLDAVDFITKPINPPVVRARVKTHLALKAQSDLPPRPARRWR